MSQAVILAQNVGKRYRLGDTLSPNTLRDHIVEGAGRLFSTNKKAPVKEIRDFWALRDISFEIHQGEVIGVIGRNGAGKTTLLKILSEITEPTEGQVRVRGRVSSLLEVGTGFHPELSGRENIYLNGAILGMTRQEIRRKFDEIVDFSGVSKFIDTPVKRYSSGMYVRLAFAVAAHLESEILLVDEVLAVGDAEFQRRCIDKMGDVVKGGRTILFVSHSMAAIDLLCPTCLLLDHGRLVAKGPTEALVNQYLGASKEMQAELSLEKHPGRTPGLDEVMTQFRIMDSSCKPAQELFVGKDILFAVKGHANKELLGVSLGIRIQRPSGERVATCLSSYQHPKAITLSGSFSISCTLINCRLIPGQYKITLVLKDAEGLVDQVEGLDLSISTRDVYGTGRVLPPRTGAYLPETNWSFE